MSISRRDFKASSGSFIITLREDQSLDRFIYLVDTGFLFSLFAQGACIINVNNIRNNVLILIFGACCRSHIVFGKLLEGQDALEDLGRLCCEVPARIVDCGIYHPGEFH